MKYRVATDEQLLDKGFREKVIAEIKGKENVDRKNLELRKYEVYKDKTRKWVIEALSREFESDTVQQMQNRAANVSILRKVVDKLAQCYVGGVERKVEGEQDQKAIDALSEEMDFNTSMKKTDRFSQVHKNTIVQIIPEKDDYDTLVSGKDRFRIKLKTIAPFLYDVIEDAANPERARVIILSDFVERSQTTIPNVQMAGDRFILPTITASDEGDQVNQTIADSRADAGKPKRTFIWWSDKYHFTTDEQGVLIPSLSPMDPGEELKNPIQILPFVNFADDQDGAFWAEGGSDLVEGAVLVNVLLTDLYAIANTQGWGQAVITGKDIPETIKGGPHKAIILPYESGDPVPTYDYASSNPPIDAWMRMIEQFVALLLSTNNLSPRNVAGKLDATNVASGIAQLIEQSEASNDVEDKQRIFVDKEPEIWERVKRWQNLLMERDSLCETFKAIGRFEDSNVQIKFMKSKPVITEKEKMEILKARKELGINTMIDLLKIDNPDLSDEEAEKKLVAILEEQLKATLRARALMQGKSGAGSDQADEGDEANSPKGENIDEEQKNSKEADEDFQKEGQVNQ